MIKVLHVDEDSLDLALTRIDLAQITDDIDIEWATCASEALIALKEDDYDCIISEYEMHGMHGLKMLRELRKNGNIIPVIFFSKIRQATSVAEARDAGAWDFLAKRKGYGHYKELLNCIRKAVKSCPKIKVDVNQENDLEATSSNGNGKGFLGMSKAATTT